MPLIVQQLLVLFTVGLLTAYAVTPLVRRVAFRIGLLDYPDGTRKLHASATPVAGGPIVLLGCTMAIVVGWLLGGDTANILPQHFTNHLGLFVAACLICALGVMDDFGRLRGRYKLLGQFLIVCIVIACGTRVDHIKITESFTMPLGILAVPFTIFWLLGAINALNLLDGMDGLLSMIGLIVSIAFAALAYLNDQWATACVAAGLAGTLLGFLRFNFPPAKIFLGDSGSMLIGLTIGMLGIQSSMKELATVSLAAPLALLILPILDTAAAIIRRKLTGRSIYDVDHGHLHHRLTHSGFSNVSVLALVTALCLVAACGALAASYLRNGMWALLSAAMVIAILVATRLFGRVELSLIKKRLANSASSVFTPRAPGQVREMSIQLQGSANWDELWHRLTAWACECRLASLQLDVNAPAYSEAYHARWERRDHDQKDVWQLSLPLHIRGMVVGKMEFIGSIQHSFVDVAPNMSAMITQVESLLAQIAEPLPEKGLGTPRSRHDLPEHRKSDAHPAKPERTLEKV
jgi:UDP-GlcNAc:undecaprenyl-phosphate GlcNAc-1-phosphate transferase